MKYLLNEQDITLLKELLNVEREKRVKELNTCPKEFKEVQKKLIQDVDELYDNLDNGKLIEGSL